MRHQSAHERAMTKHGGLLYYLDCDPQPYVSIQRLPSRLKVIFCELGENREREFLQGICTMPLLA